MTGSAAPLLAVMEDSRPPDVTNAAWEVAVRGLRAFLAAGYGAEAERHGWPPDELYAVPKAWGNVATCGAGLLIGDGEVISIASNRIGIRTPNGSEQGFYRKPTVDYGVAYRARIKSLGDDGLKEEPRLRALEAVVSLYRNNHPNADVDTAKAAVLAAITK